MVCMGLLAPGASALSLSKGKGVNETLRGRVHLLDGTTVSAYVKLLDKRQLANELVGAELARAAGLQVPDSYLVRVDATSYGELFRKLGLTESRVIGFGSRDVGRESLARRYRDAGPALLKWFVDKAGAWKRIAAFDSWVGNIDRHLGNALIGGADDVWLIDHGHCFTGPAWTVAQLVPTAVVVNRLVNELGAFLTEQHREALANEAADAQRIFQVVHVEGAIQDSEAGALLGRDEVDGLCKFVEQRKARVCEFVSAAMGRPMLDLGGAA